MTDNKNPITTADLLRHLSAGRWLSRRELAVALANDMLLPPEAATRKVPLHSKDTEEAKVNRYLTLIKPLIDAMIEDGLLEEKVQHTIKKYRRPANSDRPTGHGDDTACGPAKAMLPATPSDRSMVQPAGGAETVSDAGHLQKQDDDPKIIIDSEFEKLLRTQTEEELALLEENLLEEGFCREPLVVWKGHNILLDGHGRSKLCKKHGLRHTIVEIDLPDREAAKAWIIDNQRGRRNLTPEEDSYYRGLKYNSKKQPHGGDRRSGQSSAHAEHLKTDEQIAKQEGVSPATVRRDGEFAEATDKVATHCGDRIKQEILSGKSGLSRQEVIDLAMEENPAALQHAVKERMGREGGVKKKKPKTKAEKKNVAAAETITVPAEPAALAKTLVEQLGRDKAAKVNQELGKILKDEPAKKAGGIKRPLNTSLPV